MLPQQPSIITDNLIQHISETRVLKSNVSLGSGSKFDASGIPTVYQQDNGEGILIRHQFTTTNANETITHSLGRVPVGYFITRSNTPVVLSDDMNNTGWTKEQIVLKANSAADITVYIF